MRVVYYMAHSHKKSGKVEVVKKIPGKKIDKKGKEAFLTRLKVLPSSMNISWDRDICEIIDIWPCRYF